MNSLPGVNETLALLAALKSAVRDFVAREEKLESDFRVKTAAALNDLSKRNEAQAAASEAGETSAESALEQQKEFLQSRFEERRARINRAHAAISRRALGEIDERDAEWQARAREGVQAAEISRDEELTAATTDHENFQKNLAAAGEEVARLEAAARGALRGYGKFRRLAHNRAWPEPDLPPDHIGLFLELQKLQKQTAGNLRRFGKFPLPLIFKFLPFWLLAVLLLGFAAADPILSHYGRNVISNFQAGLALAAFFLVAVIYIFGGRAAAPLATVITGDVARMRRLYDACLEKSAAHFQSEQERIKNEFEATKQAFNQEWRLAARDIKHWRITHPATISEKAARLLEKNTRWQRAELDQIEQRHAAALARLKTEDAAQVRQIAEAHQSKI